MARKIAPSRNPRQKAKQTRRGSAREVGLHDMEVLPPVQPVAPRRASKTPITPNPGNQVTLYDALARSLEAERVIQETIFVFGPPGTGKTFLTGAVAAEMFARGMVKRIVLSRPNVPAGPTLGLLPGEQDEKMAPWTAPVMEVLTQRLGGGRVEYMVKAEQIVVVPFEHMRGHTFDDAFILLDEGQNTTPKEMRMFLTRVGKNSLMVINGDLRQKDIPAASGLAEALHVMRTYNLPGTVVEMTVEDVARSGLCAAWVRAFWDMDCRAADAAKAADGQDDRTGLDAFLHRVAPPATALLSDNPFR